MKTEKSKTKEVAVFKDMNSNTTSKQGKKLAVGIKTEAFGDKENLVQKCHLTFTNEPTKVKSTEQEDLSKDKKLKMNETEEQTKDIKRITAEDLTSEAGPSEHYWEILAEKRRQALEDALNENSLVHEKNELLLKENEALKQALAEATDVIDCLNEILSEEKGDQVESSSHSEEETNTGTKNSPVKSSEEAFGDESTILNDTIDSDQD